MNKKALVLSSGGVDSTTCISVAVEEFGKENVSTVSIFYGQKHRKELECARKVADYYGLPHYELDLSRIFQYSNCSLLDHSTEKIVHKSYEQQIAENGEGKVSTYVLPERAHAFCSGQSGHEHLRKGRCIHFHRSPCRRCGWKCLCGLQRSLPGRHGTGHFSGTYSQCHIVAPFASCSKAGVVKRGLELHTPYELTWSCYEGGDKPCGTCVPASTGPGLLPPTGSKTRHWRIDHVYGNQTDGSQRGPLPPASL